MTRQKFRLPVGGLIDRLQPVEFRFDGKSLEGYVAVSYTHLTLPTTPYV